MSLEREIEDLLTVDPSPEFLAGMRQRIAAEPAPASWWLSWRPVTAGVAFTAVVAAGLLWRSAAPDAPREGRAHASITQRASVAMNEAGKAAGAATLAAGTASANPPSQHPASAAPNRRASSPVLIQRDEGAAMKLLFTRVREGTLPDMSESLAAVDATGPEWIAIPSVVIEPIAMGEGE
jgi:hypothetical protein